MIRATLRATVNKKKIELTFNLLFFIKMYFPVELWSIVKEYAGIYSVGTKFNVSKVSKDKLLKYWLDNFNCIIKNPSKYKVDVIKKTILKNIRFKMTKANWVALHQLCNPIKEKNPSDLKGKIAELISWRDCEAHETCLGEIVGYYKNSYKVRRFKTDITKVETHDCYRNFNDSSIIDPITFTTHTFNKNKHYKGTYNVERYYSYLESEHGHREFFTSWTQEFNPNYNPYDTGAYQDD